MPTLYVVATPIGNLGDFSPRAAETLKNVGIIAAEDTRVTMKLCNVFDIHTKLISCHRHNEEDRGEWLAEKMVAEDLDVALCTDAGTPCVSDPGYGLIRACVERGIRVVPVPGCCAAVAALSVSGMDTREFAFFGFLPREKKDCRAKLTEIAGKTKIAILHESPFRITELMGWIAEWFPETETVVCSDLTKLHEKILRGKAGEVRDMLAADPKTEKGEYCIVLEFHETPEGPEQKETTDISMEARIVELMRTGMDLRQAQEALVAAGEKKNAVKQAALQLKRMFEA